MATCHYVENTNIEYKGDGQSFIPFNKEIMSLHHLFFNDEQCNNVQTLIVNLLKMHTTIESELQQQNMR